MKDLLLRARVVVGTSNMKTPRRHLADYAKNVHQKACGTCSMVIFPHSTNQIIVFSQASSQPLPLSLPKPPITEETKCSFFFGYYRDFRVKIENEGFLVLCSRCR